MAARAKDDESVRDIGTQLARLVVAYAKQETVDPLKALGRYVAWGLAGAVLLSIGLVLVSLAAVRLLQTELSTHLSGELTWVPYLGGILLALVVAGLAVTRIGKTPR
ncbi:MAG TPA: phage holin family protein [Acidimicrobiales bacterium]|nr:phage holin family protein [Acidimicrobiales bacterium]